MDRCELCTRTLESKKIRHVHRWGELRFVFDQVLVKSCPECGEVYYTPPARKQMESLLVSQLKEQVLDRREAFRIRRALWDHLKAARNFRIAQNMLREIGYSLPTQARVLDFGCHMGAMPYEYRKRGFQAFGVDIKLPKNNYHGHCVEDALIAPDEQILFEVDENNYRLPFEDNWFDLVFSHQVFEHIMDYRTSIAEIYRVLKPAALSFHVLPSRYCPIEGHSGIPFATIIQTRGYLTFWSWIGIRSWSVKGLGFREAADSRHTYLNQKTHYLSKSAIKQHFSEFFPDVVFREALFTKHRARSMPQAIWLATRGFSSLPFASPLISTLLTRVVFVRK